MNNEDFDIMSNIKLIDSYKAYLLSSVSDLFTTMTKGNKGDIDDITDEIAEIIIFSYLIAKRLDLDYSIIDERIVKKLKIGILEENTVEREYQDYSRLISYMKRGRKSE
ncbi:MAG: MazG-like family protein [Caloramator sp.]|nr:MazG-like family protein [Caloramator sp.]